MAWILTFGTWDDTGQWSDGNIWVDGSVLNTLSPVSLSTGSPVVGSPALVSVSGTDIILADYTLDHGLDALHSLTDVLHVCPSAPADYAGALAISLGSKTIGVGSTFGSPTAAAPSGRQVTSAPVVNGAITRSGFAMYWVAVDSVNSRLLASGAISGTRTVNPGMVFNLAAVTVQLPKV